MPTIKEISSLLVSLKAYIQDDFRASDDDTLPGMQITIGYTPDGSWDLQTGDNSFSGCAYGHPIWSVNALYRRSNCYDIAREIVNDLKDQVAMMD